MAGSLNEIIDALLSGRPISRRGFVQTNTSIAIGAVADASGLSSYVEILESPVANQVVAEAKKTWSYDFKGNMFGTMIHLFSNLTNLSRARKLTSEAAHKLELKNISCREIHDIKFNLEKIAENVTHTRKDALDALAFATTPELAECIGLIDALDREVDFDSSKYMAEYAEWLASDDFTDWLEVIINGSAGNANKCSLLSAKTVQSLFLQDGINVEKILGALNERIAFELSEAITLVSTRSNVYSRLLRDDNLGHNVAELGCRNWIANICQIRSGLNIRVAVDSPRFTVILNAPSDITEDNMQKLRAFALGVFKYEFDDEIEIEESPRRKNILMVRNSDGKAKEFFNQTARNQAHLAARTAFRG